MSSASATGTTVGTEFGEVQLKANAAAYHRAKRMVDAASKYDNVEDAIADLQDVWAILEKQIEEGAEYTPKQELGFGNSNASVIGESLLGIRQTVGAIRKSFNTLGK